MAPAPAPKQGLQNFSAPTPAPELAIFFYGLTPALFDLNFAGSGSALVPLRTKNLL